MKACGIDLFNENSLMFGLIKCNVYFILFFLKEKCSVYGELLSKVNLHKVDHQVTLYI